MPDTESFFGFRVSATFLQSVWNAAFNCLEGERYEFSPLTAEVSWNSEVSMILWCWGVQQVLCAGSMISGPVFQVHRPVVSFSTSRLSTLTVTDAVRIAHGGASGRKQGQHDLQVRRYCRA